MQLGNLLSEICKVSTMKATNALSKFLKTPVGVDLKPVEKIQLNELDLIMNPEELVVSIYLPIKGSLKGASLMLLSKSAALSICDELFERTEGTTVVFLDPEKSALCEVANIVIGNFLTAFAQPLQMNMLMHNAPIFEYGEFDAFIKKLIPKVSNGVSDFLISICFSFQHINIKGYIIILFAEEKINKILENIPATSPT